MVQILGFSAPVRFRGHFEEIAIAKVLLNTNPRRVGKFRGRRFSERLRKCGERKKTAVNYNGSLALATLKRATIMTTSRHRNGNRPTGRIFYSQYPFPEEKTLPYTRYSENRNNILAQKIGKSAV